ncbi:MAG: hypothetical protein IPI33_17100 [Dehalococcoidia bacterium]|nr:hypothetical protein [Dehalococcoidia bacterium]
MNGVMCELGLPGFVYGQASEFRVVIAGTQVPEAQDYDPRDLPWDLLEEGMPAERARLLHLAMTNHGAHLFGAGGPRELRSHRGRHLAHRRSLARGAARNARRRRGIDQS